MKNSLEKITQSCKKKKIVNTRLKHKDNKLRKSNILPIGDSERIKEKMVATEKFKNNSGGFSRTGNQSTI